MKKFILFLLIVLFLSSCETLSVKRIDENEVMDLSGRWNATDIKTVCDSLIEKCLISPWELKFRAENDNNVPVVVIGNILNRTSEHIDTAIIAKNIEIALLNSGAALIAADIHMRNDLREEKDSQQYHASLETQVEYGKEVGADFILQGSVRTNLDHAEGKSVRTYYVALELVDIETGLKMWSEEQTIKKYIKQANYRF